MRIGQMRHKVTIRKPEYRTNSIGESEKYYVDTEGVRCAIRPDRGSNNVDADQYIGKRSSVITMRYRDVDYDDLILHESRSITYKIESIEIPNIPNMLTLRVSEDRDSG